MFLVFFVIFMKEEFKEEYEKMVKFKCYGLIQEYILDYVVCMKVMYFKFCKIDINYVLQCSLRLNIERSVIIIFFK